MVKEFSLYEQVLENLPDGITIQDRDFNIIHQNEAMKKAFGEHVGSKCYAIYEQRSKVCEECGLMKVFQTGEPTMVHRTGITVDGSKSHWENLCFPLFDDNKNIVAGVEVCRNITDRVSLAQEVRDRNVDLGKLNDQLQQINNEVEEKAEELKRAYQELQHTHARMLQQEKLASIGQLAAGVAHEINTPIQYVGDNLSFLTQSFNELLSNIISVQEQLDSENQNTEELARLHKHIVAILKELDIEFLKEEIPLAMEQSVEGIRRVADIVLALKSFSHAGNKTLGVVELDELLRSTVTITQNAWKHIAKINMDLAAPPVSVRGLRNDLGQVLLNLIINATDAIADRPDKQEELGCIEIATRIRDGWGELVIKDTGCGIEPAILDKIFDPFFTTKEVGRGSGQGLAIAYNIITEMHGGELLVESMLNQGTTFTIRLPLPD